MICPPIVDGVTYGRPDVYCPPTKNHQGNFTASICIYSMKKVEGTIKFDDSACFNDKKEICNYECDYLLENGSTLKSEKEKQAIGALQEGAIETRLHIGCALGKLQEEELAVNSTITTATTVSSLGNNNGLSNSLLLPMILVLFLLIKSFKL